MNTLRREHLRRSCVAKPTPSTPLVSLDAIVLDTETTGLDARAARLVQIGALRIVSGAVCPDQSFDTLVRPGIPIPAVSTAIHGINDSHVASAPTFAEVWPRLEKRAVTYSLAMASAISTERPRSLVLTSSSTT